ncbi:hypothetical protein L798_07951, partial [Zootermopsis nevadensis]
KKLHDGNACYCSVQNILSSCLISKNLKIKIYKTIILPVVLYGCITWSLTVRDKHRLQVFENRMLRRTSKPRIEDNGVWRILHNDELKNLYSPNIVRMLKSRRMRWLVHVARMNGERGVHQVLVRKPAGKRLLGRSRHRWKKNIKQDLWGDRS